MEPGPERSWDVGFNVNRIRLSILLFGIIDTLLVIGGIVTAILIRFSGRTDRFLWDGYTVLRILLFVSLIQLGFYFFNLYDSKLYYGERKKMVVLFLESFAVSSFFIFLVYYVKPSFRIGRGIFAISLASIFVFSFLWRLCYTIMFRSKSFKERVLIIGTGPLARKIDKEIKSNVHHGFETVGFIREEDEGS